MKLLPAVKNYRPRDPMQMLVIKPLEDMTRALLMGDAMRDVEEMRVLERRLRAAADAIQERLKVEDQSNS